MFKKNKKLSLHSGFFKKAAITTVAFTSLLIGSAAADSKISTVYHVYLDGERVGTVDNQDHINNIVLEKINLLKENEEYSHLDLVAGNLNFVPEQVFRSNTTNESTASRVASEVEIAANAYALVIDEQPVAYLESEDQANETIKQFKLKYVSEEELAKIDANENSDDHESAPLELGKSRIVDVTLSKEVTISEERISPNQILTVEEAIQLLQKGTLEEEKYKVQPGDVLGSIAVDHSLSTEELLHMNPGIKEDSLLQIDQELNVTAFKPYLKVNVLIEEYKSEKIDYTYEVEEDATMYKGDQKVKQEGQEGEKHVNYVVSTSNGQTVKREITSEKVVKEPVTHIVVKGTKIVPSRGTGELVWPTVGGYISSKQGYRWGQFHKGIDIARPSNHTIKAADNGTIEYLGYDGGYGNKIVINHNNGRKTVYAHLASFTVKSGQTVTRGQQIGVMGTTGNSTGVHLHFEVYENGKLSNPLNYY